MARRRSRGSVLFAVLPTVAGGALLAGCLLTASLDGLTGGQTDAGQARDVSSMDASQADAQDATAEDAPVDGAPPDAPMDTQGTTTDAPTTGDSGHDGCTPVVTGLIAHYPMNASAINGTTLVDTSGSGNDAVLVGFPTPPIVDAGPLGQALGFGDAGTAYVSATALPLDTATGDSNTFVFWYYRANQSLDDVLVFAPSQARYDIWLVNDSLCFNSGTGNCWGLTGPSLFDRWVHLAAVFANGTMTSSALYVDGQLAAAACLGADIDAACDVPVTASPPVTLGGTPQDGYVFSGMLADVRVYTRALTAAEVQALYDGTACP
jgi:Concanavalin A-like lectin/glucanases superfamily